MTRAKLTQIELETLVAGIVAGYLRDLDLSGCAGRSGRIKVEVEVCLMDGEVPWSTGDVHFVERRNYRDA